jgi:anti-sigma factor RsiW
MSDHSMTCQELVELVTAYLDSALDQQTRTRFDEHLKICYGCRSYLEQFRVTIRTVGKISADQLDPGFRDRLLDAFRDFH